TTCLLPYSDLCDCEQEFENRRRTMPNIDLDEFFLGCGFFRLWRSGKLAGVHPYEFSSGRELFEATMNEKTTFSGKHEEQYLAFNLINDSTPVPDRKRFRVDAWLAAKLGLNYPLLIINTIQVVQLLGGRRNVAIVDPLK
ncbi:MAG: cadmium-containing carbonic anhydrase, partial [Patescibacteria group bacterium]